VLIGYTVISEHPMKKELLHKYFANHTTSDEERQIVEWVDASAENRRQFLDERKIWNLILLHTDEGDVRKNRAAARWLRGAAAIAASIALLLAVPAALYFFRSPSRGVHSVMVPPGQRTHLTLEDGTAVWLNARTALSCPASFGSGARQVTLNGEGYFEVKSDPRRPFVIHTEKYNIHVLGTTLHVYAYDRSASPFELSLLAGKVRIEDKKGAVLYAALRPDEYVIERDGKLVKGAIASKDRFLWKDGLICLDDEPFDVLMEKFSDYYDIRILVRNGAYSKYRCTGKFRMGDGIDYALRVLQKDVKFNYHRDDENLSITIY
jgi:ferric-dicitrate binding protein FerR (iron transport regulator)